jgi:hypothetical protein
LTVKRALLLWSMAALILSGAVADLQAGGIAVFVGYADGQRGGGFFPSFWSGDPNTVFVGNSQPGVDTGAIRIDNNTGAAITVDDVSVAFAGRSPGTAGATSFDLWGSNVVPAGQKLILAQTAFFNFDTSDLGAITTVGSPVPNGTPGFAKILITVNGGAPVEFDDTAHVLDTGGFDLAFQRNESLDWRPIGTSGITDPGGDPNGTPEPASITLLGLGIAGMAGYRWHRKKSA